MDVSLLYLVRVGWRLSARRPDSGWPHLQLLLSGNDMLVERHTTLPKRSVGAGVPGLVHHQAVLGSVGGRTLHRRHGAQRSPVILQIVHLPRLEAWDLLQEFHERAQIKQATKQASKQAGNKPANKQTGNTFEKRPAVFTMHSDTVIHTGKS